MYQLSKAPAGLHEARAAQGPRTRSSPPATTSTPTSPPATTPGTSGCAPWPTATCSPPSGRGGRRSSPTASRPSPRPVCASSRAPSSRRTSSSRPPGSSCSSCGGIGAVGRRQAHRPAEQARLQGHDARRTCPTSPWRSATRTPRGRSRPISPASSCAGSSTPCTDGACTRCVPVNGDAHVVPAPLLGLTSGYVQRSADRFPKQGSRFPWQVYQSYLRDYRAMKPAAGDRRGARVLEGAAPGAGRRRHAERRRQAAHGHHGERAGRRPLNERRVAGGVGEPCSSSRGGSPPSPGPDRASAGRSPSSWPAGVPTWRCPTSTSRVWPRRRPDARDAASR